MKIFNKKFQSKYRVRTRGILGSGPIFLLFALLLPLTASAMTVSISSGGNNVGGLVGHWQLNEESEQMGSELVTNGAFDSGDLTGWTSTGNFSVVSNELVASDAYSAKYIYNNNDIIEAGKRYRITYNIVSYTSGELQPFYGDPAGTYITLSGETSTGLKTLSFTASMSGKFGMHGWSGDIAYSTIDNISLKEIHAADSTVNNNDGVIYGATYTAGRNAKGLGENLVTNGTFDADSGWQKGTGWTIGSGVASCNSPTSTVYLDQDNASSAGTYVKVTYTITSISAGSVQVALHSLALTQRSAVGTYSEYGYFTNGGNLTIKGINFVGSIDNISIREVVSGQAMSFDGVDDYISVTTDKLSSEEGTFSARFYPTTTGANDFIAMAVGASTNRFYLKWDNSALSVWRGEPAGGVTLKTSTPLNTWYNVVMTWSGTTINGYLDGEFIGTSTFTNPGTDPTYFNIGSHVGAEYVKGKIQDVRVYNRALSVGEIKKLYEGSGSTAFFGNTTR